MLTDYEIQKFREGARDGARWYFRNQNCDQNPWGGMRDSADKGRFVYEYFPAEKSGRGAGVWAQALGIMALDAVNRQDGEGSYEYHRRKDSATLAGRYLMSLQYGDTLIEENRGGFAEHVPGETESYPRDAATGGLGLIGLYQITKEEKYVEAAKLFADWYVNHGSDENNWPYISFSFKKKRGTNKRIRVIGEEGMEDEYVKGDWQAGGGLVYYYLSSITGERKYIDDYLLPMIEKLVSIYEENPYAGPVPGFHGSVPISFGNDDFALITLLGAYIATGCSKYYEVAKGRILDYFDYWDRETGRFPSYGGTFTSGITMKALMDLDLSEGRTPDPRLQEGVEQVARGGLDLQASDYNEPRVNGGYWGQSEYGVGRDRIHHRSTGYATIFYAMISSKNPVPWYHCLHWPIPK